jgi:hypothetical protein
MQVDVDHHVGSGILESQWAISVVSQEYLYNPFAVSLSNP